MRETEIKRTESVLFACSVALALRLIMYVGVVLAIAYSLSGEWSTRALGEESVSHAQRTLVDRIVDTEIRGDERITLMNDLAQLPDDKRESALAEIINRGDEGVAHAAALWLLKHPQDIARHSALLEKAFREWSRASQSNLLNEIAWAGVTDPLIDIPRGVLRDVVSHREPESHGDPPRTTADASALLLAKYKRPEDVTLISGVVREYPTVYGAWLALARIGSLSEDVKAIAREVFVDESYARHVRAAAAVALAPEHKDAEEFAIDTIQEYLQEFSDLNLARLWIHVASGAPREKIKGHEHFPRYERDLMLVSMLLFMDTKSAEELTFRYLHAKDMHIRAISGLIAVLRWPEKFLQVNPDSFAEYEPGEYNRLLGFLVREHRGLKGRAIAVSSEEKVERAAATARPVAMLNMCGKGGFLFIGW